MISPEERKRMLQVPMASQRMISALEKAGVSKLEDLRGKDVKSLVQQINAAVGYREIQGPLNEMALNNLIGAADGR